MEAKITTVRAREEDWLGRALATQLELEEVWQCLEREERYRMVPLSNQSLDSGCDESGGVRLVCLSDTHSMQSSIEFRIPDGDILIHAGDFTRYGLVSEVVQFNEWLGTLPHKHKIVIAGNHELSFDPVTIDECRFYMEQVGEKENLNKSVTDIKSLLTNCTYLEDESLHLMGIKFYGSPWQPRFSHSAFNLTRGPELRSVWDKIPSDTDILITHSPPLGVLDRCRKHTADGGTKPAGRSGCEDLLHQVVRRVKPRYQIFGHVHECYGVMTNGETVFINASTCNKKYEPVNHPVLFTFKTE